MQKAINGCKWGLLGIIMCLFAACDDPFDLSLNLQQDALLGTTYTDTLTLRTSVVLLDSVSTTRQMSVGSVGDAKFGSVRAATFSKLMLGRDSLRFTDTQGNAPIYDSLVLVLQVNYRYGDTTALQDIQVHRLAQKLDTGRLYHGFDNLPVAELLGQARYGANLRLNQLRIRLDDRLGREIIARSGQADLRNQANFEEYINGLRISATGPDAASIIGLDVINSRMSVFYRNNATDTVSKAHAFYLLDPRIDPRTGGTFFVYGQAFTQFRLNVANAPALANLPRTRTINTASTGNEAYIQAGAGIVTRVEIPHLRRLVPTGTGRRVVVNRALLSLHPTEGNYNAERLKNQAPPRSLSLAFSDANGRISRDASNRQRFLPNENFVTVPNAPRAEIAYIESGRSYLDVDITTFVQRALDGRAQNNGLILASSDLGNTVNKLLFADAAATNADRCLRLKLHYTIVNE